MGDQLAKLRKLTGQLQKLTYEAVKSGTMAELSEEEQLFARAMREHMHVKHIHNALEFADVREGVVSPLAYVAMHAAVKGQLEQLPEVRTAFEKMVATGTPAHQSALYFSAGSYVTAGYGDVVLPSNWRMLGPLESIIGVLMCGISVSVLFATVARLVSRDARSSH
jgi:hypothetical protein